MLSLTFSPKCTRGRRRVRGVVWIWVIVGEECEVVRGVGVGENVDCSAECDMECTMVTSGGEI